jgi:hypothetical protein
MTEAIFAYILANLMDIISTNKVLKKGGVELNPVMRWAMEKFGNLWPIPKLAMAGVALGLFYVAGPLLPFVSFTALTWIGAAVFALVAANNFRVARKI